eukprot:11161289-Lingulodinium_polyedra.AAC.1
MFEVCSWNASGLSIELLRSRAASVMFAAIIDMLARGPVALQGHGLSPPALEDLSRALHSSQ